MNKKNQSYKLPVVPRDRIQTKLTRYRFSPRKQKYMLYYIASKTIFTICQCRNKFNSGSTPGSDTGSRTGYRVQVDTVLLKSYNVEKKMFRLRSNFNENILTLTFLKGTVQ
jgi:hypothetical protein